MPPSAHIVLPAEGEEGIDKVHGAKSRGHSHAGLGFGQALVGETWELTLVGSDTVQVASGAAAA